MEFLLSLIASTIFAAETFARPSVTFGQLTESAVVLGETTDTTSDDMDSAQPSSGQSMFFTIEVSPTPTPASTQRGEPTPIVTPTNIPKPKTQKNNYTIALLGDSMIDTLGPGTPNLHDILTKTYPGISFQLLNYGVGATNILYGKQRLNNSYNYLGNQYPSLLSLSPDIIVIESFGYNPLPPEAGDINTQWLTLSQIVDEIHASLPATNIIIAATIAPDANTFGDGAPGLSFDKQTKKEHTDRVKQYIENAIAFADSQHLPLADVYHASLDGNGNGKSAYINSGDHIHYSDAGRALFAQQVFKAIEQHKLLY